MLPVIIGIVVVVVIASAIAGIYNNMVTKRNRIDNAWQNIDTQLQRRNDLIPNLVETVKGYAKHEQDTLAAVVNARNAAVSATTPEAKMEADNVLTGALRQLFAVAEAYLSVLCDGAGNTKRLQSDTDRGSGVGRLFAALFNSDRRTDGICPNRVLKTDGLRSSHDPGRYLCRHLPV